MRKTLYFAQASLYEHLLEYRNGVLHDFSLLLGATKHELHLQFHVPEFETQALW